MPIGNLQTAASRLQDAYQKLGLQWQRTTEHWRDDNARRVEEEYLRPVAQELNRVFPAISQVSSVLQQAERSCSDEER